MANFDTRVSNYSAQELARPDDVNPEDLVTTSPVYVPGLVAGAVAAGDNQAPMPLPVPAVAALPASPLPGGAVPGLPSTAPVSSPPPAAAIPGPTPADAPATAPAAGGGIVSAAAGPAPAGFAGSTPISQGAADLIGKGERSNLDQEAQANQSATTDFKKDMASKDADTARREAELQAHQQKELDDALAYGNKFVSDAQAHVDQKAASYQQALEEDKSHTIFTGKSTWQKAGAWLGLAVGAIGAGFSAAGGHATGNQAVTQLNKMVEDDFARQRAGIADLKDSVAMAQTGLRDAQTAKQALQYDLLARQKAAYLTLESQAKASAAGLGVKAADLDGSTLMTTLKQKQEETERSIARVSQLDALNKVKTYAEVRKSNAEANNADAQADYHRALARGEIGPYGGTNININGGVPSVGSKTDKAIMSSYVNPARREAAKDKARVQILSQLSDAVDKDPNLTYGQAKQILINGFTAAGGNPGGRIAVADIHEVLPGMQSAFGKFISELDQGSDNKVSPEFRKTVGNAVKPELQRWTNNYQTNRGNFKKNLGLPDAAADHYTNQIYPDIAPAAPAAGPQPPKPGLRPVMKDGVKGWADANNNFTPAQ